MSLFKEFTKQLDNLSIEYTWDPDFDDQGVLAIDSESKDGKKLSVAFLIQKSDGTMKDVMFNEFLEGDVEFKAQRISKDDRNGN